MFWKFFISVMVLGGVYLLGKLHARRGFMPHLARPTQPFSLLDFGDKEQTAFRATALGLVLLVITLFGWFIYRDWQEAHQVVEVRVIHLQSGQITAYQALKGDLHGRSFLTLDGRRITLADVERLEVGGGM